MKRFWMQRRHIWIAFPWLLLGILAQQQSLHAKRFVSLSPSITEIMQAIGAEDVLVGVTHYCQNLPSKPTRVGGVLNPNYETILALKPDCVLASPITPPSVIQRLKDFKINILVFKLETLRDILNSIKGIAKIVGREREGEHWLESFRRLQTCVHKQSFRPKVLVVYGLGSTCSAGQRNFIDDIINLAGGNNLAHAQSILSEWPRLPMEFILYEAPDVIFVGTYDSLPSQKAPQAGPVSAKNISQCDKTALDFYRKDVVWQHTPAVRNSHVYALPMLYLETPGPNIKTLLQRTITVIKQITNSEKPKGKMVEPIGIEPTTSSLRTTRSTN
jgi:ABC-type Fe3+-hydroxamate transport system substrate-binding protein